MVNENVEITKRKRNKLQELKDGLLYNLEDEDLIILAVDIIKNPEFSFEEAMTHFERITEDKPMEETYVRKFINECQNYGAIFFLLIHIHELTVYLDLSPSVLLYILINVHTRNLSKIGMTVNVKPILDISYKNELTVYNENGKQIENLLFKDNKMQHRLIYTARNGDIIDFIINRKVSYDRRR